MKALQINDTKVLLYSSIKELPIDLAKKFNAYLLQDIGIGSTMADVDAHLEKVVAFLNADKRADAIQETINLRYNLFSMITGWDYSSLAFACLIQSVDEKLVTDYEPDGLLNLLHSLSEKGMSAGSVEEHLADVKKNLIPNADFTSPPSLKAT